MKATGGYMTAPTIPCATSPGDAASSATIKLVAMGRMSRDMGGFDGSGIHVLTGTEVLPGGSTSLPPCDSKL